MSGKFDIKTIGTNKFEITLSGDDDDLLSSGLMYIVYAYFKLEGKKIDELSLSDKSACSLRFNNGLALLSGYGQMLEESLLNHTKKVADELSQPAQQGESDE